MMEAILSDEAPEDEVDLNSEIIRISKLWHLPKPKTDAIVDHLKYHEVPLNLKEIQPKNTINGTSNAGYLITEVDGFGDMKSYLNMQQDGSSTATCYTDMTHFQKKTNEVYSLEDNTKQKSEQSSFDSILPDIPEKKVNNLNNSLRKWRFPSPLQKEK